MFYIYVDDARTLVIHESGLNTFLASRFPYMIFPRVLPESLLQTLNIYPITIRESLNDIPVDCLRYTRVETSAPYKEGNQWFIDSHTVMSEALLQQGWDEIRAKRNALLAKTDWIETSQIVTQETKDKYRIYRQLLRDAVGIADYPHQVVLPPEPPIQTMTLVDERLSADQVEQIKSYRPKETDSINALWLVFLDSWQKTNFTTSKNFVSNLMQLITGIDLYTVITSND